MPTEIYLIKVGMSMTEGIVEEWYIPDGATVEVGELLYRLETEKVNLDVDAEATGTVRHLVAEGITLEPGAVVGYIYAAGEEIPDVLPGVAEAIATAPGVDSPAAPSPAVTAPPVTAGGAAAPGPPGGGGGRSSPNARRLARELNIDLASVAGTGPGGRITREDVAAVAEAAASAGPADTAAEDLPAAQVLPLRGMRKTIATRMHESLTTMAQLTMDMDVVMDDAIELRSELIEQWRAQDVRPTYTDLVVCAAAKALRQHPFMNAQLIDNNIHLLEDIHLGIAVALEEGLIVPVVKGADQLSLQTLVVESARLAQAARESSLTIDELQGGTFTVSTLGMFGVDSFTPIINAPQAGILGVNRIRDEVAWDGAVPVKRQVMRLSLTWDHRVLDGAPAAHFLAEIRNLLEDPHTLLV
jgi:pyruvate dehydrogenase E2 component (dihydrolipoamide acetyltransferase)